MFIYIGLLITVTLMVRLFGWTLTRTPPPPAIVPQRASQRETDPAVLERLNRLETTVERLELDNTERQLAVLNIVEKIQHQLRARERKRERDAEVEIPDNGRLDGYPDMVPDSPLGAGVPLVNRFRRY